jgi:iron(III) transport system ATP-binding protein
VARFVGEAVVLSGEARGRSVTCVLGTLAIRGEEKNGPVRIMIRPEQIRLQPGDHGPVAGRVVGKSFFGAETEVHLELLDEPSTPVVARTFDETAAEVGERKSIVVEGPVTVYQP